jgi:hypothetical protein
MLRWYNDDDDEGRHGELEMTMMISSTAATLTGELVNNLVCGSVSFTNPFGYVLMLSHVHVSF